MEMVPHHWINLIEGAWLDQDLRRSKDVTDAVSGVIELLDKGKLRVAEPQDESWVVNEWVKKAV